MTSPTGVVDDRSAWKSIIGEDLPFDADSVFRETTGFFVKRANAARAKLIAALKPTLLTALEAGGSGSTSPPAQRQHVAKSA